MAEKTLIVILSAMTILPWIFHGDKLGRQFKTLSIVVVDVLALLMLCMSKFEFGKKVIVICIFFVGSLFWIIWGNRGKKDINLQDLKESRLDDYCFCIGMEMIIVFLVRMFFGVESF